MKASLKFREDQKPLFRAKVPLSVLGLPFQSSISAGDSKELCLNLGTLFERGPSFRIAYRPNDSWNPFSIVVKTGIGSFGSPISAPMTMSAEFNLLGHGNPSFYIQFKPRIGDFSIKKSTSSHISLSSQPSVFGSKIKPNGMNVDSEVEDSGLGGEVPIANGTYRPENGVFFHKKINGLLPETHATNAIDGLFSGLEFSASTVLPVRNRALLKFRAAFIEDGIASFTDRISLRKFPFLAMKKISIEHVAEDDRKNATKWGPGSLFQANADVTESCFTIKRQLEVMQAENRSLRKAIEDLLSEVGAGKQAPGTRIQESLKYRETERSGSGKSSGDRNERRKGERKIPEFGGGFVTGDKGLDGDINAELKNMGGAI
uniref:Uncharacterized protein n=1 Tax=Nelumbo nucifera TaxID=4432 RepID=A0A822ZFJ1_NELNU|nr:TPA_asm: hypothetical protein HUJ06_000439 [Nelumbo nucifera]